MVGTDLVHLLILVLFGDGHYSQEHSKEYPMISLVTVRVQGNV